MNRATDNGKKDTREDDASDTDRVLAEIQKAIRAVRYGSVEIVIHDSKVVQIERREKTRFTNA